VNLKQLVLASSVCVLSTSANAVQPDTAAPEVLSEFTSTYSGSRSFADRVGLDFPSVNRYASGLSAIDAGATPDIDVRPLGAKWLALTTSSPSFIETAQAVSGLSLHYYPVQGIVDTTEWNVLSEGTHSNDANKPATPEPGTYALTLAGLVVIGFIARRRLNA